MEPVPSPLVFLQQRTRSALQLRARLSGAAEELGVGEDEATSQVCAAYALLKMNVDVEQVARMMSWREFEELSSALIRASGFDVEENVYLTKPRAQIDIVAYGTSYILCVDCKHWKRSQSSASLAKVASEQLNRSSLLRAKLEDGRPIVSVILSMSQPEGTFVQGVPVVPVRSLRSFLETLEGYSEYIDHR
jgi:Restriction endonuclease